MSILKICLLELNVISGREMSRGPAAEYTIKSSWYSDKIFFKHMFELEFRAENSKTGLPIVVLQTDKLCSTAAYDSGSVLETKKALL